MGNGPSLRLTMPSCTESHRSRMNLTLAASVGLLPVPELGKPVLDDGNRGWGVVASGRSRQDEGLSAVSHGILPAWIGKYLKKFRRCAMIKRSSAFDCYHHQILLMQIEQFISVLTPACKVASFG